MSRDSGVDKSAVMDSAKGVYMDLRKTYVPVGVMMAMIGVYWWLLKEVDEIKADIRSEVKTMIVESRNAIHPAQTDYFLTKEAGDFFRQSQEEIKSEIRILKENQKALLENMIEIKMYQKSMMKEESSEKILQKKY